MIISNTNRANKYEKWFLKKKKKKKKKKKEKEKRNENSIWCLYQTRHTSTSNEQWPSIERPFPWGRYLFHQTQTSKDSKMCMVETLRGIKDKKGVNTQCLLARTVCFTASTKGQNGVLPLSHKLSKILPHFSNYSRKCPCFETR